MPLHSDKPLKQLARTDHGAFAAGVLLNPTRYVGQRIDLASDENTPTQMAAKLSATLGTEVGHESSRWRRSTIPSCARCGPSSKDLVTPSTSRLCMRPIRKSPGPASPTGHEAPSAPMSVGELRERLVEHSDVINRALPAAGIGEFVRSLAHRIAGFPAAGRAVIKDRINGIALAPADDFRRDSNLFVERARDPETQRRIRTAMARGFQTHDGEMALPKMVADLVER